MLKPKDNMATITKQKVVTNVTKDDNWLDPMFCFIRNDARNEVINTIKTGMITFLKYFRYTILRFRCDTITRAICSMILHINTKK